MILEHNPNQAINELRLQGLYFMGFVVEGYYHIRKKVYPIEALV